MAAPFGEWKGFDCLGYCRNAQGNGRLIQVHNGTPNPRLGTNFNIFEAEQHATIWNGKVKLSLHANNEIYMSEKDLEQDLISGWSVQDVNAIPQIERFGRRTGAHPNEKWAWHSDTPDWIYNPNLAIYLHYYTSRPGNYRDVLPDMTYGEYNTLSVTVRADEPRPNEPWDFADRNGAIVEWQPKNVWLISWPTESWELPYYFSPNRGRGGHSEPGAMWMPYVHPTEGWPGFVRLFGRSQVVPNPPSAQGNWAWVLWYIDSPDGITNWTSKTVYGDPRYQFTDTGGAHPLGGLAGGSPGNPSWLQAVSVQRTNYRGSYQAGHCLDQRAGGVHAVFMTKVHNRLAQSGGGGDIAHAFSNDILNPTWDTWEVNPNTPLIPGTVPGDMGSAGFNRCPTVFIDEAHPAQPGGQGGRLVIMAGGGPGPDEKRPRYTYVYVAERPPLPPSFPEQPLGSVRLENYSDKQRDTTWTCRIPLRDTQYWDLPANPGDPFPITVKAVNTTLPNQRVKARVVGPRYDSGNPQRIEITFRHTIAAGVSDPDYPDYEFFRAEKIDITSGVGSNVAYQKHANVDFSTTTFQVRVPGPAGNEWLTLDLENAEEIDAEIDRDGVEVMKRYRAFQRVTPTQGSPSLFAELIFDVPTNSRQCRWWLEIGNSNITPHDQFTWERTSWALPDDVLARVSGARCSVYYTTVKNHADPVVTAGPTTDWTVIKRSQSPGFGDGYVVRAQGQMLFEGGTPTQLEQDSIEGDAQYVPECNSLEWRDHGYGPFGEFTGRPNNSLVYDEDSAFKQAAKQSTADWRRYDNRRWPWFFAIHGTYPASSTSGASDEWGAYRGFHHAASGSADFRALRISVMNEGIRGYHFRYPDGSLFNPLNHTGRSGEWSDCFWWHGRQFFGNQVYPARQFPTLADNLGKREGPPSSWAQPQTIDARSGWTSQKGFGYDNEHHGGLWSAALGEMTGDPHAVNECIQNSRSVLCQMWPKHVDYSEGTSGSQITGLHESRADGRMGLVAIAMWRVTGEATIKANLQQRIANVVAVRNEDWDTRGSRVGWLGAFLDRSRRRIIRIDAVDARHAPWPAENLWQQSISMLFYWAAWRAFGDQSARDIATEVSYALTMHGSRRGQSSSGKWQLAVAASYSPYDNNNSKPTAQNPGGRAGWGVPVLPADREDGRKNPLYLYPGGQFPEGPFHNFMLWYGAGLEGWVKPAYVLGYERAIAEGNQAWAQTCAEQFADLTGVDESRAAGTYGFGRTYGDNFYEWIGYIANAWKERPISPSYFGAGVGLTSAPISTGSGTVVNPTPPTVSGSGVGLTEAPFGEGTGSVSAVPVVGAGVGLTPEAFGRGTGTVSDPLPPPSISGSGVGLTEAPTGQGNAYKAPVTGSPTTWVAR